MPTVAFQGEFGAFSELAAREFFGASADVSPSPTFLEVFGKVRDGRADAGIIPIENSLAGSIHENYDLLLEHELRIIGEIKLRIVHHLMANEGVRISEVRRVVSHPQALAQCREYIRKLRNVETVSVYDTAGAARELRANRRADTAAIASAQAAADYELQVLARGIESNHQNFTRFLVVAPEGTLLPPTTGEMKVSVAFSLSHEPGSLFKSLAVFALRDINLLKIESRPLLGEPWQYLFYLDFAGSLDEERCGRALDHLGELTAFVRVLGNYAQGHIVDGSSVVERPAQPLNDDA